MKLGKPSHGFKIVAVANMLHLQTVIVLYNSPWRLKATDIVHRQYQYFSLRRRPMAMLCFSAACPLFYVFDCGSSISPPRMHIPFFLHTIIVHISKLSHQLAILLSDIPSADFAPRIGS
jgi:hypothetical protein